MAKRVQAKASREIDIRGWRERAFIDVKTAAAILGCGTPKVWTEVYSGNIPSIKWGSYRRISVPAFIEYIAKIEEEGDGGRAA